MSGRRPTRRLLLVAATLSLCAMGSDYRGCGNATVPPDGVELPMSDEGCLVDADCGADECSVLGCVAGECVPVAPIADVDGDGYAPVPCGDDCNDVDSSVFPGAAEVCDGRDQDCDGTVDERAPGARTASIEDGLSDATLVGLDAGFGIVGTTLEGAVGGYVLTPDGAASTTATLFTPDAAEPPIEVIAAASEGSRVVVAFALEGGPPSWMELTRTGTSLEVVRAPEALVASGDTTALAVHVFGGVAYVAFDVIEGIEEQRSLFSEASGALTPLLGGDAGPFVADDGARLVVATGDARLDFLAADGSLVASHMLPGAFASGRAIASSGGAVVAAYRDAFDHNLTTVTTSSIRSPSAAPFGSRDETLSVHALAEGILVTRIGGFQARAWILAADLRTYLATFSAAELTREGVPSRITAASDGEGTSAFLSSHEGRSAATLLRCTTAP